MRNSALKPLGAMRSRGWFALCILIGCALATALPICAGAAPAPRDVQLQRSIPDWMSLEAAESLGLGFDVLVPDSLPAPLSGEPEITAYDGYYSLYWVIPGTPPTFLQITGEVGGTIPDYSKYDRNVQLEQNAAVSGSPAYHDLTPIYDLIYWEAGGVVYSVESQNLADTDSLSVANALSVLDQSSDTPDSSADVGIDAPQSVDAGDTATIAVQGGSGTLTVDYGAFTANGDESIADTGDAVEWEAPSTSDNLTVTFALVDPSSGATVATARTLVVGAQVNQAEASTLSLSCPDSATSGERMSFTLSGSGKAIVDAAAGTFPADSPNTDFMASADGTNTLVGTVPESGSIDLVWVAPDVDSSQTVYLFASTEAGDTPGECDVLVTASTTDSGSSADQALGDSSDPTETPVPPTTAAEATDPPEPTAKPTKAASKPTKTPKAYNEVLGLPTAIPLDDGTAGGDGRGLPTPTVPVKPTVRPTATIAPTTNENGMMAQSIGPDGGSLESPLGITVIIPKGALDETVTLSIQPVTDTKLPPANDVNTLTTTGFDVAIAGPDGLAVTKPLKKPAEIRIAVAKGTDGSAKLYRVDGAKLVALTNTRREKNTLSVSVTEFDRFVAGVPIASTVSSRRNALPFILAAVVVLIAMIAMVTLGGIFRPRRQRIVVSRRPKQRSRFR